MSIQFPSPKLAYSISSSSSPDFLARVPRALAGKVVSFLDLDSAATVACLSHFSRNLMNHSDIVKERIRMISNQFRKSLSLEMIHSNFARELVRLSPLSRVCNRVSEVYRGCMENLFKGPEAEKYKEKLNELQEFNKRALLLLLGNSKEAQEKFYAQSKHDLLSICYVAYSASRFDFEIPKLSRFLNEMLQDNETSANLSQQDLCLALVMLDSVTTEDDLSSVFLKMAEKLHAFPGKLDPVGVCRVADILRKKGITSSSFYEKIAQVGKPWSNSNQKFLYRLAEICLSEMSYEKRNVDMYKEFLSVVFKCLRRVGLSKLSSEECVNLVLKIRFSLEVCEEGDAAAIVALAAQRFEEVGMPSSLTTNNYCTMVEAYAEVSESLYYNENIPESCFVVLVWEIYPEIKNLTSDEAITIAYNLLKYAPVANFADELAGRLLSLEFENGLDLKMCLQIIRNFYESEVKNKEIFCKLAFILGKQMEPAPRSFKLADILKDDDSEFLRKVFLEKEIVIEQNVYPQLYSQLYGDGDEEMSS